MHIYSRFLIPPLQNISFKIFRNYEYFLPKDRVEMWLYTSLHCFEDVSQIYRTQYAKSLSFVKKVDFEKMCFELLMCIKFWIQPTLKICRKKVNLEIPHFSYSSSCRTENAETAVLISISYWSAVDQCGWFWEFLPTFLLHLMFF